MRIKVMPSPLGARFRTTAAASHQFVPFFRTNFSSSMPKFSALWAAPPPGRQAGRACIWAAFVRRKFYGMATGAGGPTDGRCCALLARSNGTGKGESRCRRRLQWRTLQAAAQPTVTGAAAAPHSVCEFDSSSSSLRIARRSKDHAEWQAIGSFQRHTSTDLNGSLFASLYLSQALG